MTTSPAASGEIKSERQTGYVLVLEDWLWHTAFPLVAYVTLLAGALTLTRETVDAFFGIAAASIFLLFIGIHNAWDGVTYVAALRVEARQKES